MNKTTSMKNHTTLTLQWELVVSRIIDAPREDVFKAWTNPELVKQWWGPDAFTCPFAKIDLRVGGKYLFDMRGPDGRDYWSTGVYKEIVRPEKIVCTDSFADEKGNVVPASSYGLSADYPLYLVLTVFFEEFGRRTKLTIKHSGTPASDNDNERQGWNQSLDKLEATLHKIP